MRFRSKKREKQYRTRRTLVEQLLDERRICERCGMNPSTDIHEVIRRSQWRDGINVLSNLRALCRACHRWVTDHPAKAVEEGWSDWSWNRNKYLNHEEGRPE